MTPEPLDAAASDWAAGAAGSPVAAAAPLTGGCSSRMLGLTHADGRETVLRQMLVDPWRRHAASLLRREAQVQVQLANSPVVVPEPLAVDLSGSAAGAPSLLMSRLPGAIDLERCDDGYLAALADVLVLAHRFRPAPTEWPRDYQSWAFEAKRNVPSWSRDASLYHGAFAMLAQEEPGYRPTFLHRDFQPGNVLWVDGAVSGVVDWVETSTGPADLDVAHCASNLATLHGAEVGVAFRHAYAAAGGALSDDWAYWQVLDLVGFLPAAGRESGADEATTTATWRAHGRDDLTLPRARARREQLLRLTLGG